MIPLSVAQPLAGWRVLTPAGLTDTGRIRRFQDRTVQRLSRAAREIADAAYQELLAEVGMTYTQGEGTLLSTLQYQVIPSRTGIEVRFSAGGRHLVFLTALAGQPTASPGHFIPRTPKRGKDRLRFFWNDPPGEGGPGMYSFRQVFWRTRQGRDVMAEVLGEHAAIFTAVMLAEHDRALVELTQAAGISEDLRTSSRRVSVQG